MSVPRLLVNLKAYLQASGEKAVEIARQAEKVWRETGVLIGIAPNVLDLKVVAESVDIPVYSQHVDPIDPGAHTGHIPPELVKKSGARGSLLNHSEKQIELHHISVAVTKLRELDLSPIVCAPTPQESAAVAALSPDAVAIEPPELIGTGIPVSKAKPEIVQSSLKAVIDVNPDVDLLCGAGITSGEDVRAAIRLGSYGVLVASAVAKSPNPYEKMEELVRPFVEITRA
ncbi:MAG: triose-phosphate isomerase [Candidatus Korarchaeota archaeon]|nr:triose-phosphate isomerase [Candidatus Korarchaeota archaeon]